MQVTYSKIIQVFAFFVRMNPTLDESIAERHGKQTIYMITSLQVANYISNLLGDTR